MRRKRPQTGMDTIAVAGKISQYTSGYPYLVSAICKILDEELPEHSRFLNVRCVWNKEGVAEAVSMLLKENTSLFGSMAKQLATYEGLRKMIEAILYQGKQATFSPMEKSVHLGVMFGFLKEENGCTVVANRIFEMALLNLFMAGEAAGSS